MLHSFFFFKSECSRTLERNGNPFSGWADVPKIIDTPISHVLLNNKLPKNKDYTAAPGVEIIKSIHDGLNWTVLMGSRRNIQTVKIAI